MKYSHLFAYLTAASMTVCTAGCLSGKTETQKTAVESPKTAAENTDSVKTFRNLIAEKKLAEAERLLKSDLMRNDRKANDRMNDIRTLGYAYRTAKKYDDAQRVFEMAKSLGRQYKATMLFLLGDNHWGHRGFENEVEKYFLQLMRDKDLNVADHLNGALQVISKVYIPMGRFDDAKSVIAEMRKENLLPAQRLSLAEKEADILLKQNRFQQAVGVYSEYLKDGSLTEQQKNDALNRQARLYRRMYRFDEAAALYQKNGAIAAACECLIECGRNKDAVSLAEEKIIRTAKTPDYVQMIEVAKRAGDDATALKYVNQVIANPKLVQPWKFGGIEEQTFWIPFNADWLDESEKAALKLFATKNKAANNTMLTLAGRFFERRDLKRATACYKRSKADCLDSGWGNRKKMMDMLVCLALSGEKSELNRVAAELTSEKSRVSASDKAAVTMFVQGKVIPAKHFQLDGMNYANAVGQAGKLFVQVGDNVKAEQFNAAYKKLFIPHEQNRLKIRYVKNAPCDVGSWLSSGLLDNKADRADVKHKIFEDAAAFLVTDVMASTRKVGDSKVQADKETYFYVCYDEYGLHLFFVGVDSKVKDVLAGRLGGSGYEMYLAVGEHAPSYQWLFEQPKDKLEIPPWNSPHEYYRRLENYVTISSQPVENGFATAMNFPWELAYDRLPKNGDAWPFEIIRWTRAGGVTWGGDTVWDIGHWGRLEFSGLTSEVLTEIRRIIIYKAYARYQAQNSARSGGAIAIWQDAELGDPEFYAKALKPEVDRLNELGKLVTDNMSAPTVNKLWIEAVPYWFDFQYRASKIRAQYLNDRFISTGK